MAKQSGLGDYLAVDDSAGTARDISNDVTNVEFTNAQNLLETTGLDKSAMERIIGLSDGSVSISGIFNPAANKSHAVFKTRTGTRTVTYAVGGNDSTNPELNMEMLIDSYNVSRGTDGSVTWSADLSLQDGTVPTWGTV